MLELRLVQGSLMKKVLQAIKELVKDTNFDCSDIGFSLQLLSLSPRRVSSSPLLETLGLQTSFASRTRLLIRARELSSEEMDLLMTVLANPRQFKVSDWFLNRKKDYKDGRFS
ncbi:hypothetical protein ZWY2020_011346 [Hordeum vulgare]|nr:hypothetical protein ZWY2020_011346 [Hordeum vulgare]